MMPLAAQPARLPQRLTTRQPKAGTAICRGNRLDRPRRHISPLHHLIDCGKWRLAAGGDAFPLAVGQPFDQTQP